MIEIPGYALTSKNGHLDDIPPRAIELTAREREYLIRLLDVAQSGLPRSICNKLRSAPVARVRTGWWPRFLNWIIGPPVATAA